MGKAKDSMQVPNIVINLETENISFCGGRKPLKKEPTTLQSHTTRQHVQDWKEDILEGGEYSHPCTIPTPQMK